MPNAPFERRTEKGTFGMQSPEQERSDAGVYTSGVIQWSEVGGFGVDVALESVSW